MRRPERSNSGLTRIALFSAILISSVLISFQRGGIHQPSGLEVASQETAAPLAALMTPPLRWIEQFFVSFKGRKSALEENTQLREEVAILRERQARYDNLAFKVARNVGSKDGVKIGNPVLSTQGLVGHVINTGPNTTRVLRLSDLNSRIAVASARSGATAILAGDNTSQPKLSFINQRENWAIGDRVISSGDDGALPRGLDIGVVIRGKNGEMRTRLSRIQRQSCDLLRDARSDP